MWKNHPAMAKRWEAETPKNKPLPEYATSAFPRKDAK
jgi:hypothetical protein